MESVGSSSRTGLLLALQDGLQSGPPDLAVGSSGSKVELPSKGRGRTRRQVPRLEHMPARVDEVIASGGQDSNTHDALA